ncbi:MAG: PilN domain-containing protein [Sedimentisphaerales bacterium]|nr:PilN domain-containing protein [Sedimentisphaerales bacterium]
MLKVNFVPDDYVQSSESCRTNIMYLVLFALVMAGLGGAFTTIKIRQHAILAKERVMSEKMVKAKDSIEQFERLQQRRKKMMKTALTTAELLEPVPRSVLLAAITNNLPVGTSLLKLEVEQRELKNNPISARPAENKFQKAANEAQQPEPISPEQLLETKISIEGMAPSDLQVASLIENLGISTLLTNVALVESKEEKDKESKYRKFKLTAKLSKDVHLSKEDVDYIRAKCRKNTYKF